MKLDDVIPKLMDIRRKLGNVEVHTKWPASITRNETGVTLPAIRVIATKILGDRGYNIVVIE